MYGDDALTWASLENDEEVGFLFYLFGFPYHRTFAIVLTELLFFIKSTYFCILLKLSGRECNATFSWSQNLFIEN